LARAFHPAFLKKQILSMELYEKGRRYKNKVRIFYPCCFDHHYSPVEHPAIKN